MHWRQSIRLVDLWRGLASTYFRSAIKRAKRQQFDPNFSYYRQCFRPVGASTRIVYAIPHHVRYWFSEVADISMPYMRGRFKTRGRHFFAKDKLYRSYLHCQDLFHGSLEIILYWIHVNKRPKRACKCCTGLNCKLAANTVLCFYWFNLALPCPYVSLCLL